MASRDSRVIRLIAPTINPIFHPVMTVVPVALRSFVETSMSPLAMDRPNFSIRLRIRHRDPRALQVPENPTDNRTIG